MSHPNLDLARRFVLGHNREGYQRLFDELLASTVVVHEYIPQLPVDMDRAAYDQFIAAFRAALPDIHNDVVDVFGEGDRTCVRWVGRGTHTGAELMGVPAKGAAVTAHGIYILRFEGDRIAEIWDHWDNLNVLEQLRA